MKDLYPKEFKMNGWGVRKKNNKSKQATLTAERKRILKKMKERSASRSAIVNG